MIKDVIRPRMLMGGARPRSTAKLGHQVESVADLKRQYGVIRTFAATVLAATPQGRVKLIENELEVFWSGAKIDWRLNALPGSKELGSLIDDVLKRFINNRRAAYSPITLPPPANPID